MKPVENYLNPAIQGPRYIQPFNAATGHPLCTLSPACLRSEKPTSRPQVLAAAAASTHLRRRSAPCFISVQSAASRSGSTRASLFGVRSAAIGFCINRGPTGNSFLLFCPFPPSLLPLVDGVLMRTWATLVWSSSRRDNSYAAGSAGLGDGVGRNLRSRKD